MELINPLLSYLQFYILNTPKRDIDHQVDGLQQMGVGMLGWVQYKLGCVISLLTGNMLGKLLVLAIKWVVREVLLGINGVANKVIMEIVPFERGATVRLGLRLRLRLRNRFRLHRLRGAGNG